MDFSFRKSRDAGVLALNGELVSQNADEFRTALMLSICNAERVVICFDDITKIDTICVRTFCTALRKSKTIQKYLIFDRDYLRAKIRQDNIACSLGCEMYGDGACLLTQP